ncbi:W07G4.4_0 protein [Elysia marginata]|uniref:W07G4.4_0 protein n=1 Tax=Elysia marginata TaxID=1093978 RepID=A0AAV4HAN9_9GAST|nr:W07G4.4_0 protein [Elysia marginata]
MGANPSVRGHQGPAAFLIMASGLDNHGINSSQPLAYSHLDIAGSARMPPKEVPAGVPVVALSGRYILGQGAVTSH